MKRPSKILIIIIAFIVVLLIAKNIIIKIGVENGVRAVTGLSLKVRSIKVGIFRTRLIIHDLQLFNPEGFPDRTMVDIPEIYVDYSLLPLLAKKIQINEARFYLKEFFVVKDKDGKLNLDALKALAEKPEETEKKEAPKKGEPTKETKKKEAFALQIDLLKLKVENIIFKDYSKGGDLTVRNVKINLDETYENITNPATVVSLIVFKALMHSGMNSLMDLNLPGFKNMPGDLLKSTAGIAQGAVNVTGDTLKKTTEGVKSIIKLPFGKKE